MRWAVPLCHINCAYLGRQPPSRAFVAAVSHEEAGIQDLVRSKHHSPHRGVRQNPLSFPNALNEMLHGTKCFMAQPGCRSHSLACPSRPKR